MRPDGRAANALRPVTFTTGVQRWAEGSVEVAFGDTRVLCAATVEEEVPRWMRGSGRGWITAEYSMLPRATTERTARDSVRGKIGGRTHEIQRLIGRSLRAAVNLDALGPTQITVDCDVIQADGGTRTAAITGAWVALSLALDAAVKSGRVARRPVLAPLAAVSVGMVGGEALLDLCYAEDVAAETDMNVVVAHDAAAGDDRFVEVQGTAEREPFTRRELDALLDLALDGCRDLFILQAQATAP